jgi:hypothetical protein
MYVILIVILCGLTHEFGHWAVAKWFGQNLKFRREGWRFLWDMPEDLTPEQKQAVGIAGFATELISVLPALILCPFYGIVYQIAVDIHFIAYQFYANGNSDFQWNIDLE